MMLNRCGHHAVYGFYVEMLYKEIILDSNPNFVIQTFKTRAIKVTMYLSYSVGLDILYVVCKLKLLIFTKMLVLIFLVVNLAINS